MATEAETRHEDEHRDENENRKRNEDRYIVVQGPGYYGTLYAAYDTHTGRLEAAPDYRYYVTQWVVQDANGAWLHGLARQAGTPAENMWRPVVDSSVARVPVALAPVDKPARPAQTDPRTTRADRRAERRAAG